MRSKITSFSLPPSEGPEARFVDLCASSSIASVEKERCFKLSEAIPFPSLSSSSFSLLDSPCLSLPFCFRLPPWNGRRHEWRGVGESPRAKKNNNNAKNMLSTVKNSPVFYAETLNRDGRFPYLRKKVLLWAGDTEKRGGETPFPEKKELDVRETAAAAARVSIPPTLKLPLIESGSRSYIERLPLLYTVRSEV